MPQHDIWESKALQAWVAFVADISIILIIIHFFFPPFPQLQRPAALNSLSARTRSPASPRAGAVMGRRTVQMDRMNPQTSVSTPGDKASCHNLYALGAPWVFEHFLAECVLLRVWILLFLAYLSHLEIVRTFPSIYCLGLRHCKHQALIFVELKL